MRKSTSKLQAVPSEWVSILDSISDAVSVHGERGEIVWANKVLCEIYGRSLSELRGVNCPEVDPACTHQTIPLGTQDAREVDLAGRVFSVAIEPLTSKHGTTRGFLRVMHDVTVERQAQLQLLEAERFATLGQLFSGLVHDVGTPLNIISGYSEFLLMRTKPDDPGHKELSAILHQTKRIAALFEEAVDFARLPQAQTVPIDIQSLLAGSLNLLEHHLRKIGVKAQLTCRISTPLVYGEASQLKQAFLNLLINAGRQLGEGGDLDIIVDREPNKPEFLAVGMWGTEASAQGHDFSRSLRSLRGESREAIKSGLGLSLARDILDKAGARIAFGEAGGSSIPLVVYLPTRSATKR